MDENKLKSELLEVLKKHAKPREEVPKVAVEYFTDEKVDEMVNGLVQIIAEYAKQGEQ